MPPRKPPPQDPPRIAREYFTQKEIAAKLGVSEAAVRDWIKTGVGGITLRALKFNRSVRVHGVDLERFLAAVRQARDADPSRE